MNLYIVGKINHLFNSELVVIYIYDLLLCIKIGCVITFRGACVELLVSLVYFMRFAVVVDACENYLLIFYKACVF